MANLFGGRLLTADGEVAKGKGGSVGLRFMCANRHSFTRKFDVINSYANLGSPSKLEAKDLWCVKCHNFYFKCVEKA